MVVETPNITNQSLTTTTPIALLLGHSTSALKKSPEIPTSDVSICKASSITDLPENTHCMAGLHFNQTRFDQKRKRVVVCKS